MSLKSTNQSLILKKIHLLTLVNFHEMPYISGFVLNKVTPSMGLLKIFTMNHCYFKMNITFLNFENKYFFKWKNQWDVIFSEKLGHKIILCEFDSH